MDVQLAEERVLILGDRFSVDHAEGRAWQKRIDAFGTMAKLTGMLARPRDEEFTVVYRERRLQPFWHIGNTATFVYERERDYRVPVDANVQAVMVEGVDRPVVEGAFTLRGTEQCRDEVQRDAWFDGVGGTNDPTLAGYMKFDAIPANAESLAALTADGNVIVPPQAKASSLVRDVIANSIQRIEADRVLEERMHVHHIDLYYRPVYAFRYRWKDKEAVVEFDGLTGDTHTGGVTFEQLVGQKIDAAFLINAGVEAAGIFIPGVRLAEIVISRSIAAGKN